jgi:hypothetical protein
MVPRGGLSIIQVMTLATGKGLDKGPERLGQLSRPFIDNIHIYTYMYIYIYVYVYIYICG